MKNVNFDQFTSNTFLHKKDLVLWITYKYLREEKVDTFSQSYFYFRQKPQKEPF